MDALDIGPTPGIEEICAFEKDIGGVCHDLSPLSVGLFPMLVTFRKAIMGYSVRSGLAFS